MSPVYELKQKMGEIVPSLPDDVCRCHDLTGLCGQNNQCRRWLQKDTGGVRVRHGNLLTLDALGQCINFMDVNEPCTTTNPAIPDK